MIKEWFTHNAGLKLIALVLAVVTWIYINHLMVLIP